jgi:anti-anti-sigma regulatory factor
MKKRAHIAPARRAQRASARRNAGSLRRGASGRARTLALPVECTLADADTLKVRLAALLKNANPVRIEVGLVRRIDTASLQLLASFAHERRASGLAFATSGESNVFAHATRLLGLKELLDPDATPSRAEP